MRLARIIMVTLLILGMNGPITAQQDRVESQPVVGDVALVNVNLIRMNDERIEPGQTVIVRGNRITAIGVSPEIQIPQGAIVIDGSGRYLVPGLTDAHVPPYYRYALGTRPTRFR